MRRLLVAAILVVGGCALPSPPAIDPGSSLQAMAVSDVQPLVLLPSSSLAVGGQNFVDAAQGVTEVHLVGNFVPAAGMAQPVDQSLSATVVDATHLSVVCDEKFLATLPARVGKLEVEATVVVLSNLDGKRFVSSPMSVTLDLRTSLQPRADQILAGALYLNDEVVIDGKDFLLGGGEGETHAILQGCVLPIGSSDGDCQTEGTHVSGLELIAAPPQPMTSEGWQRRRIEFPFSPAIVGLHAASFQGTVRLRNVAPGWKSELSPPTALAVTLGRPLVSRLSPAAVSLGQYLEVQGRGFVGAAADEVTLLHLFGSFTGSGRTRPIDVRLVPQFISGSTVRYVVDEHDALGQTIDLRQSSGHFSGKVEPILRKGADEAIGVAGRVQFDIAPIKQVVFVNFERSYSETLKLFGLAAADEVVRQRVLEVARRDYLGVNLDFRTERPTDFALYEQIDVEGPDPNDSDEFGKDNTPGKDTGNLRLYDHVGGVNATTQIDGSPGYGGVFAVEFLGFSSHPPASVRRQSDPASGFDDIFDAVRPDTGIPLSRAEVAALQPMGDASSCGAGVDRDVAVACAVRVFGSLVGTTMTHEIGHSLGLAFPHGKAFHDIGDEPNRLMDAGGGRPFNERAELRGEGPAVFCDDEFDYLTTILPHPTQKELVVARPGCL